MRALVVSMTLAAAGACIVEPAPPPRTPYGAAPAGSLAVAGDAYARLEASATLDGGAVADVAPAPAATVVVVFASWCGHCRDELAAIDVVRARHRDVRTLGVNYRPHEEYDHLGDAAKVRAYVDAYAPWLIVVPADDTLFAALGRPPKVPTIYVYDRAGRLVEVYDRRTRPMPTAADLDAVLDRIGP
jgi:thiol-disulfide isomerase/thioredoxin